MATILDLYKDATKNKAENELYGKDSLRIESRGLVNVPRQVALLASSPNSVADLIGGQVAGLLGGNATRPSDTIFKDDKPFRKPVTVAGGLALIDGKVKDAIEPNTSYFVKQSPSPASFIQKVNQGTSNPLMTAANIAADALRNPLATKRSIQNIAKGLKKANESENEYGSKFSVDKYGNKLSKTIKFSEYNQFYGVEQNPITNRDEYVVRGTVERNKNKSVSWDYVNDRIISNEVIPQNSENPEKDANKFFNTYNPSVTTVQITQYGNKKSKLILPGTISGLSEDFSPDWINFKYVGSPFNSYRYTGIERSIKFNLKLYWVDDTSKEALKNNLDELRKLVHPYEEISTVTYGNRADALAFSPNLLYLTITGLYTNLFGFLEELSFNIDDSVSWGNRPSRGSGDDYSYGYPTVIDVSLGFKIIPNFGIKKDETKTNVYRYNYNFTDGGSIDEIESDYQSPDPKVQQAKSEKILTQMVAPMQ